LFDAFGHVEIEGFEENLTLPKSDLTHQNIKEGSNPPKHNR